MQFLLEGIIRNNSLKLFCLWTGPVFQMSFKDILSRALETLLFGEAEPFVQFW